VRGIKENSKNKLFDALMSQIVEIPDYQNPVTQLGKMQMQIKIDVHQFDLAIDPYKEYCI